MSIFRDFFVKEKPVFTGIARGLGGFGFGKSAAGGGAGGSNLAGSVVASGGSVQEYTDSGTKYRLHIFGNGDSDFLYTSGPGSIDIMVMGGGGSGAVTLGDQDAGKGGGGSGGLAWVSAIPVSPGTTCAVTVGNGGRGHYGADAGGTRVGRNGSNSVFVIPSGPYTVTGAGGGGGGVADSGPNPVAPTRSPNTNTNSGAPGGSGGGSGSRNTGNSNDGGPGTQPGQNPSMPWVTNFGSNGGGGTPNSSGGGGGGGGIGANGAGQSGGDGGTGGAGKNNFTGSSATTKALLLGTKGLGTDASNPHTYATPSNPSVYFGGGGGGAPGTGGNDFSNPLGLGGLGGGGRAGLGRNYGQSGPENSLLPSAYWYQIGGITHMGGGGGGSGDAPNPVSTKRQSGGFAGKGGKGVVVVRYEYTEGSNSQFVTASGGTTSTDGDYKIHTFSATGTTNAPHTFTVTQKAFDTKDNTIEVLVVAGGGGGGKWSGGGGGAGGVAHTYNYSLDHPAFPGGGPWALPIQVGGGGAAQTSNTYGNAGNPSYFGPTSLRVFGLGGGGGGANRDGVGAPETTFEILDGGSGGGGTQQDINSRAGMGHQRDTFGADPGNPFYTDKTSYNNKIVTYQYGNAGGVSPTSANADMGGGGGAGGAGADGGPGGGYSAGQGHGGPGVAISITGSSVIYGGGGTAASPPNGEAGAPGGGGQGGGTGNGGNATDGLGGGGGGCYSGAPTSGRGGSGTVIVRYKYQ